MRTFNEEIKCNSNVCLGSTKYSLTKVTQPMGCTFVFTVDEPNKERDQIVLTPNELKALYLCITSNEEKK